MLEQTFLRRLVIVRRDLQRAIGAGFIRRDGQINRFVSGIAARASEHFNLSGGELNGLFNEINVFFKTEGRRLACRADRHDALHACLDLRPDQVFVREFIDFAVSERRDNGCVGSGKHEQDAPVNSAKDFDLASLIFGRQKAPAAENKRQTRARRRCSNRGFE